MTGVLNEKPVGGLTSEEALHAVTVSHLEKAAAGVRGQGGVGSVGQQHPHHVQVVVLHGVVNRPARRQKCILTTLIYLEWLILIVRQPDL